MLGDTSCNGTRWKLAISFLDIISLTALNGGMFEAFGFPLIIFLIAASFVVAAINYFRQEKEPPELASKFLFRFYAYSMLFISLLVAFYGASLTLKSSLSYPSGISFSYRGEPVYEKFSESRPSPSNVREMPPPEPKIKQVKYSSRQRKEDLTSGVTFLPVGILFFIVHYLLRRRLENEEEQRLSFLYRCYLLVNSIVYGGISLIALPAGLRDLLKFYLLEKPPLNEVSFFSLAAPGEMLSFALVAFLLWLFFIKKLLSKD